MIHIHDDHRPHRAGHQASGVGRGGRYAEGSAPEDERIGLDHEGRPAAAEYMAFQQLAVRGELASVLAGGMSGMSANGLERELRGFSSRGGDAPDLTEINVPVEETSPAVDMMKQMGPMKIMNTVTSVSTDPLPDDLFTLPSDFKIAKP